VIAGGRLRAEGLRFGDIVAYDWGFRHDGRDHHQRTFVLLSEGMQIAQSVIFPPEQQGWWYCDLVKIVDEGSTVHVDDRYIDVIIGPPDHPYRVLDLDEYAAAAAAGMMTADEAAQGLVQTQRFLDRRLNRRHEVERTWPDFPPAAIEALLTVDLPQAWHLAPE
jgi:hypothetical protein